MADIFLNNGDIGNTMYGDIAVVSSYDDITQSAVNNVLTIFGENQYHTEIGNMAYRRRLKTSGGSLGTIEKDCVNAIMVDDRVANVTSINAEYDPDDMNNVNIKFTIMATDGTLMSSGITITI